MALLTSPSSPKSCKLEIVATAKGKERRFSHGFLVVPTTRAFECVSVKNRLSGSRRRGSGINRHNFRIVSKTRRIRVQGI